MRAVESAAQVMAGKIGATTKSREGNTITLGVLLANLKAKIDALPKSAERDNWHEAHALLQSVNISWRTKTAHTGSFYTQVEADGVWSYSIFPTVSGREDEVMSIPTLPYPINMLDDLSVITRDGE